MFSPSSPVTGTAVTGLTSPTYTLTAGTAMSNRAKQYTVSALGGTQTGVSTHSIAKPFTHTFTAPERVRSLPSPNPITGVVRSIPNNTYRLVSRIGVVPYSGATPIPARFIQTLEVPAGSETNDVAQLKALLSSGSGIFVQQINGILDTMVSGEP